jgi:hypothetical protein
VDRTTHELAERIRWLTSVLSGKDPLPQDFLVSITRDRWMTDGSVTPNLPAPFVPSMSGLLVEHSTRQSFRAGTRFERVEAYSGVGAGISMRTNAALMWAGSPRGGDRPAPPSS